MNIQTLMAALALTVGGAAFAQAPAAVVTPKDRLATPRVDQRQVNQQRRVDEGVASGALNSKEVVKLERREDKIARLEAAAKADGTVTKTERRRLDRAQDNASAAIKRQKHDGQKISPVAAQ